MTRTRTAVAMSISLLAFGAIGGCKDKASDPSPAAAPAKPPAGRDAAPGASDDVAAIKAVLEAMHQAAAKQDAEAGVRCLAPQLQTPMLRMLAVQRPLEPKVRDIASRLEAIDPLSSTVFSVNVLPVRTPDPLRRALQDGRVQWERVKVEVAGDTATCALSDGADGQDRALPLKFRRIDGRWYAVPESMDEDPGIIDEMNRSADKMEADRDKTAQALDRLDADLKSGKITQENVREVIREFARGLQ